MKRKLQWISIGVVLALSACDSKNETITQPAVLQENTVTSKVVPLWDILNSLPAHKDQEITVAGYLFTHEEGAWIGSDIKSPLENTLALSVPSLSKISSKDPKRFRWWFSREEGFPALIKGTLRIGEFKNALGIISKNHPWIEVSHATEVDVYDPRWTDHR